MPSPPPAFSRLAPIAWYLALATGLLWPSALAPIGAVPGAPRTDLADSLWTFWFVAGRLGDGALPDAVGGVLNHPEGGAFWPADPVNAVLVAPLVLAWGPAIAWAVAAHLHVAASGLAAHALGRRFAGNGYVAGTLYAAAPIAMAHLHNGASEAVGGTTWLALAALAATRLRDDPGPGRAALAAGALALSAVGHAYSGAMAGLWLGVLLLASPGARGWLLAAGLGGVLLAAGPAAVALDRSTARDNVVGIKTDKELATIRRTIGPADPEVFVHPGDFRSPDFHELSRYGEELVHCAYLGWVPLLAAAASLRRRRGSAVLWVAGLAALVLSMGPVLVADGGPVILAGRRAVPLPYLALERLPGFGSLSLVWRLAQLTALALAVLAARAPGRSPRLAAALVVAALAELRLASPARALPGHWSGRVAPEITALAAEPDGAVMNYPVVGGRAYLYEQTVHHKPVTGSLNFPNNNASRKVWKAAMENAAAEPETLRAAVEAAAREADVRYLVVHIDARAKDDDLHTDAVAAIKASFTPIASSSAIRVYRFW